MKGRPHTSPECRCAACVKYDREQEENAQWPYVWWAEHDDELQFYPSSAWASAHAAECAAWESLILVCDAVGIKAK